MKNDQLSLVAFIPKQKSKIPSRVSSSGKQESPAQCFPHPQHQTGIYFPQPECCYLKLPLSSATSRIHTSFTKCHSICMHNTCNILIYFESIITKCTSYIMALHETNFVFRLISEADEYYQQVIIRQASILISISSGSPSWKASPSGLHLKSIYPSDIIKTKIHSDKHLLQVSILESISFRSSSWKASPSDIRSGKHYTPGLHPGNNAPSDTV